MTHKQMLRIFLFRFSFIFISLLFPSTIKANAWTVEDGGLEIVTTYLRSDNIYSLLDKPEIDKSNQTLKTINLEYGLNNHVALIFKHINQETQSPEASFLSTLNHLGLKFDISFINPGLMPGFIFKPNQREKVASLSIQRMNKGFKQNQIEIISLNGDKQERVTGFKLDESSNSFYLEAADKFLYENFNVVPSIGYGKDFFGDKIWSREHIQLAFENKKFHYGLRSDFFSDSFSNYREINRKFFISIVKENRVSITFSIGQTNWKFSPAKANTYEIQFKFVNT